MTVTTTPSNLLPLTLPGNAAAGRTWIVQNLGTQPVTVLRAAASAAAPSAATVLADGVTIGANQAIEIGPMLVTTGGEFLWARTATGTADVRVLAIR
jgi:hypothetical protein